MDLKRALEDSDHYLMHNYKRLPVLLRKGRGVQVWDSEDREYLDFVGGIATNVLGHCHPKVVVALQKQAQRLIHVSNIYQIEPQIRLARLLVENSFADKVFFCNSGAEAGEAAIKLARKYSYEKHGEGRHRIITALGSFHGRTMATVTATGQEKMQKGFAPLLEGFSYVPFGNAEALEQAVDSATCAVMLEPIQGEIGVRIPPPDYLKQVREICDRHGLLLILDEVQTGMGRTGRLFAHEHAGIVPDIMTLAKGLGGGVAIGAMLATDRVAAAFTPGDHGSTFGGNPLATAAGVATMETILENGFLLDQCHRMGKYLLQALERVAARYDHVVTDLRGMGLLVGMELNMDCAPIVVECLKRGLLINCAGGTVLRFMPPLIVVEKEIDQMAEILDSAMGSLT
jgi:predicted acetylornithine/succinylornithine family transaminase